MRVLEAAFETSCRGQPAPGASFNVPQRFSMTCALTGSPRLTHCPSAT